MKKSVKAFLEKRETEDSFDILRQSLELKKIIYEDKDAATPPDELAELYAFSFFQQHEKNEDSYVYGPQWVLPNNKGEMREFPSRSLVTGDMLEYWFRRSGETANNVLRSRYADLVYDFTDENKDRKRKFSAALEVIKANFELANKMEKGAFRKYASRALYLIQSTNNTEHRTKFIEMLIEQSSRIEEYSTYVFRNLIADKKWRRYLSEDQVRKVVENLDKYLSAVLPTQKQQPWSVDELAVSLAKYYTEQNQELDVQRILGLLEKNFRESKYSNSSGMLKSNYLETLRTMYDEFAQFEFSRVKRDTVTNELTSIADEVEASMQEHTFQTEVTAKQQAEIDDFIEWIFKDDGKNPLVKTVTQKIVANFLPKLDAEKASFESARKENVTDLLFTQSIVGEDGFNIAKLNGYEESPDQYFIKHYSENLQFNGILLRIALQKLVERFTPEEVLTVIMESPLFRKEDVPYVTRGLKGFWEKDYLVSSHLFIPLIEDGFRTLHRINGLPIIKTNKDGGFDFHNNLEYYIDHDVVSGVFGPIGDNFRYYAKILLVTRMGWNLRHNFAHGINKSSLMRPDASERLLHVLFCLSLVRLPRPKKEGEK
jgi:hypothetical protein